MPKTTKEQLAAIKSDYEYVKRTYGDVIDFTGSGMESTQLDNMLKSPCNETAFDCFRVRLIAAQINAFKPDHQF